MHHRIYTAAAVLALSACNAPGAQADPPITVKKKVCDRWVYKTKPMRGTDHFHAAKIAVDGKTMHTTPIDGNRIYGYGSNMSFTLWSPARKGHGRAKLRFVSMDGACHRVRFRYTITRYAPGKSPYS